MFMLKQGGRIRWKELISSLAATDYCTAGMCHGWLVHLVYNASYASLFAMNKDKQMSSKHYINRYKQQKFNFEKRD